MDTIGSVGDTVLAVYTGSSLTALNQVAANDDLFPVNSALAMYNYSTAFVPSTAVSSGGITVSSSGGVELFSYYQDYYGPSGLRFTARAGTTYYFAVDTKSTSQRGLITLNWAYKSSGVFRWATEDVDPYASIISSSYNVEYMPLYKTSDYESEPPDGLDNSALSVESTYYNYNAPGVLVRYPHRGVFGARSGGLHRRCDGDNLPSAYSISPYDAPAHGSGNTTTEITVNVDTNGVPIAALPSYTNTLATSSGNYAPVSGTLVFDDFEMSKTILIPVYPSIDSIGYGSNPLYYTNVYKLTGNGYQYVTSYSPQLVETENTTSNSEFGVVLSNPRLDPYESSDVSPPRVNRCSTPPWWRF